MKTQIVSLFILTILNIGCASNPIPTTIAAPCTTSTETGSQSTFVGDQVPDMQTLIDEGKFDHVMMLDDPGSTWNGWFPQPISMKIDDLKVVDFGTDQSYEQIVAKIEKLGYTPANSHEAAWFATSNPDQQKLNAYYGVNGDLTEFKSNLWIVFGSANGDRNVSVNSMVAGATLHHDIQVVVHNRVIAP